MCGVPLVFEPGGEPGDFQNVIQRIQKVTQFPPIDEPTILAINDVIGQCEDAARLFRTALGACDYETLRPLLRQGAESGDRIVAALRDGLIETAGEVAGEGTVKGFLRRIREGSRLIIVNYIERVPTK